LIFQIGSSAAVATGDVVTVEGPVKKFNDLYEIYRGTATKTGTGTAPAATDVDAASLADKYRGSLVKVTGTGLKVTEAPTADNKYNMKLENGILIYGQFLAKDALNAFPVGTEFSSITAIYDYQYAAKKLFPLDINGLVKKPAKKNRKR